MLTVEVEMTAVTRDADKKAAGTSDLTRTEMLLLVVAFLEWVIVVLLVAITVFAVG